MWQKDFIKWRLTCCTNKFKIIFRRLCTIKFWIIFIIYMFIWFILRSHKSQRMKINGHITAKYSFKQISKGSALSSTFKVGLGNFPYFCTQRTYSLVMTILSIEWLASQMWLLTIENEQKTNAWFHNLVNTNIWSWWPRSCIPYS